MTDDEEDSSSTIVDEIPQIKAHKEVWSQKELLRSVISRYFIINGELGGTKWPVWKVNEKESLNAFDKQETKIVRLMKHLTYVGH